jgi:predicted polyphosphate/ATP-dependent NAD kinase
MAERRRIGLIVNPVAGIGGPLAAHGSDHLSGTEIQAQGGASIAEQRAKRALMRLHSRKPDVEIVVASGPMGASAALSAGFAPILLDGPFARISNAKDTRAAAAAMIRMDAELILFAGGDGTGHDIFAVVGGRLPLVGIPTGVKMHSAVFALSPEAAGETVALSLVGGFETRLAEIMDADEAELAAGRLSARLFGYARIPALPRLLQPAKGARPDGGDAAIEALGRRLSREARQGQLIILGPGTTMAMVKRAFGLEGSLLGVDVMVDGKLIATDADAAMLEALCEAHKDISLIVGVVGGQGFVFGRGNQQISPKVLRAATPANLRIVATREKLLALPSPELRIDTGDVELDRSLEGYRRVETGPNDAMVMRFSAGF